jgi:alkyldihydroxyacetonephosphate synthase
MEALINAGTQCAGGVLVLGFESADHPMTSSMERAAELCRDSGGELPDPVRYSDTGSAVRGGVAADTWRDSFLRMPYQRDALAARSMIVETFETACTWDRFPALHAAVEEAAASALASVGAPGVLTCRFSHVYQDGPAPYFGIYAAGRPGATLQQWDEIKVAVSDALIANGATITHHHAVGRDHRQWYDQQRPDLFATALSRGQGGTRPSRHPQPGSPDRRAEQTVMTRRRQVPEDRSRSAKRLGIRHAEPRVQGGLLVGLAVGGFTFDEGSGHQGSRRIHARLGAHQVVEVVPGDDRVLELP